VLDTSVAKRGCLQPGLLLGPVCTSTHRKRLKHNKHDK